MGELSNGDGLEAFGLLDGLLLQVGSLHRLVVLTNLPEFTPVCKSLCHSLVSFNGSIWPLPGEFAALEAPEKSFEPFGVALGQPCFILEVKLIIGGLLGFLELVLDGVHDESGCMLIFVGMPMVASVQELTPGG